MTLGINRQDKPWVYCWDNYSHGHIFSYSKPAAILGWSFITNSYKLNLMTCLIRLRLNSCKERHPILLFHVVKTQEQHLLPSKKDRDMPESLGLPLGAHKDSPCYDTWGRIDRSSSPPASSCLQRATQTLAGILELWQQVKNTTV